MTYELLSANIPWYVVILAGVGVVVGTGWIAEVNGR